MASHFMQIEQGLFRAVNSLVEPAVRRGIGSPSLSPAALIVLETVGFKSGRQRRTPLWSIGIGRYRIISTARGRRSFWVKNLKQQPEVSFYLGGRCRESSAIVITDDTTHRDIAELTPFVRRLAVLFARYAREGWAFVILVPAASRT
jgi:deazaflavin-dependent oxidoreductase (nitroreductase family)